MGNFKVTQTYKGAEHDGLDLVGLDSKDIHATVNGVVKAASKTDPKGFGINVKILKDGTNDYYIYAHMSEVRVKVGDRVKITDVIGIEGSTGNSTGSHCHYCVRTGNKKGSHKDISAISGIPNALGTYNDGYVPNTTQNKPASGTVKVGDKVRVKKGAKTYTGGGLASFVYDNVYDVIQMKGDRVVIGKGKAVTAAVKASDLLKV